jgi:hypothetical protein
VASFTEDHQKCLEVLNARSYETELRVCEVGRSGGEWQRLAEEGRRACEQDRARIRAEWAEGHEKMAGQLAQLQIKFEGLAKGSQAAVLDLRETVMQARQSSEFGLKVELAEMERRLVRDRNTVLGQLEASLARVRGQLEGEVGTGRRLQGLLAQLQAQVE